MRKLMLGRVICFSSVQLLSCARLFVTNSRLKRREREERVEAEGRLKSPGFLVHHQLPELAQTHVQQVSDAIQPSYTLVPFSCLQSFPASGSFPMSQFFASGGQSVGASASASVLPMNIQVDFL